MIAAESAWDSEADERKSARVLKDRCIECIGRAARTTQTPLVSSTTARANEALPKLTAAFRQSLSCNRNNETRTA
jgi:hypothetical protein